MSLDRHHIGPSGSGGGVQVHPSGHSHSGIGGHSGHTVGGGQTTGGGHVGQTGQGARLIAPRNVSSPPSKDTRTVSWACSGAAISSARKISFFISPPLCSVDPLNLTVVLAVLSGSTGQANAVPVRYRDHVLTPRSAPHEHRVLHEPLEIFLGLRVSSIVTPRPRAFFRPVAHRRSARQEQRKTTTGLQQTQRVSSDFLNDPRWLPCSGE